MGSNKNLENLVRSGGLKAEPPDRKECEGLLRSATDRLKDAHSSALSFASRFDLAYNAAHALALTAMRLQGFRSDRRYLAEYEGYMDVDETLLAELLAATDALLPLVQDAMLASK